jgi:hypothetical protein
VIEHKVARKRAYVSRSGVSEKQANNTIIVMEIPLFQFSECSRSGTSSFVLPVSIILIFYQSLLLQERLPLSTGSLVESLNRLAVVLNRRYALRPQQQQTHSKPFVSERVRRTARREASKKRKKAIVLVFEFHHDSDTRAASRASSAAR